MDLQTCMQRLEAYGSEQTRKIYRRHGGFENMFGVSYANLKLLVKEIKKDQLLAEQLWETGNHDARTLATMIADPAVFDPEMLERWVGESPFYPMLDALAGLGASLPDPTSLVTKWTASEEEWIGYAGWQLLAHLAMNDKKRADDYFAPFLVEIEARLQSSPNRTKHGMNGALIAIGTRNDELEAEAIRVASKIGKVVVDHGETACKTPDAIEYIQKVKARKSKAKVKS